MLGQEQLLTVLEMYARKCAYCGNESNLRDSRGNCIACGAPRPAPPMEIVMPDWKKEQHPVVEYATTMFCSSMMDAGSFNGNINKCILIGI